MPSDVGYAALSRADDETYVCAECGHDEAIDQLMGLGLTAVSDWPVHSLGTLGVGHVLARLRGNDA